jgi:hypothetical protein
MIVHSTLLNPLPVHHLSKKLIVFLTLTSTCLIASPVLAQSLPIVVGQDGKFLGTLSQNQYDSNSICNPFGQFGNEFAQSIFNRYGNYGGEYSNMGAYNPSAKNPPIIVQNRQIIGIVTKNRQIEGRVDPDLLLVEVCGR